MTEVADSKRASVPVQKLIDDDEQCVAVLTTLAAKLLPGWEPWVGSNGDAPLYTASIHSPDARWEECTEQGGNTAYLAAGNQGSGIQKRLKSYALAEALLSAVEQVDPNNDQKQFGVLLRHLDRLMRAGLWNEVDEEFRTADLATEPMTTLTGRLRLTSPAWDRISEWMPMRDRVETELARRGKDVKRALRGLYDLKPGERARA